MLALSQSRQVAAALERAHPGLAVELEVIRTTGDKQQSWKETPAALGASGGKGIFVKEIEDALLEGRIDAAVHSMKDMPTEMPAGLGIVCVPLREDPRDVLISRGGGALEDLPRGARLGTGSPRRISQLKSARPDLEFVPIRGNVDTRLGKVTGGELDGVVLAAAGLARLGLTEVAAHPLSPSLCLPAPGQGALAIESRRNDAPVVELLRTLHDPETATRVDAERSFLEALGGGCLVPAAALAELRGDRIRLDVLVARPDGSMVIRASVEGDAGKAREVGSQATRKAMDQGAGEILALLREGENG